jgi:hypothetical protein
VVRGKIKNIKITIYTVSTFFLPLLLLFMTTVFLCVHFVYWSSRLVLAAVLDKMNAMCLFRLLLIALPILTSLSEALSLRQMRYGIHPAKTNDMRKLFFMNGLIDPFFVWRVHVFTNLLSAQ